MNFDNEIKYVLDPNLSGIDSQHTSSITEYISEITQMFEGMFDSDLIESLIDVDIDDDAQPEVIREIIKEEVLIGYPDSTRTFIQNIEPNILKAVIDDIKSGGDSRSISNIIVNNSNGGVLSGFGLGSIATIFNSTETVQKEYLEKLKSSIAKSTGVEMNISDTAIKNLITYSIGGSLSGVIDSPLSPSLSSDITPSIDEPINDIISQNEFSLLDGFDIFEDAGKGLDSSVIQTSTNNIISGYENNGYMIDDGVSDNTTNNSEMIDSTDPSIVSTTTTDDYLSSIEIDSLLTPLLIDGDGYVEDTPLEAEASIEEPVTYIQSKDGYSIIDSGIMELSTPDSEIKRIFGNNDLYIPSDIIGESSSVLDSVTEISEASSSKDIFPESVLEILKTNNYNEETETITNIKNEITNIYNKIEETKTITDMGIVEDGDTVETVQRPPMEKIQKADTDNTLDNISDKNRIPKRPDNVNLYPNIRDAVPLPIFKRIGEK